MSRRPNAKPQPDVESAAPNAAVLSAQRTAAPKKPKSRPRRTLPRHVAMPLLCLAATAGIGAILRSVRIAPRIRPATDADVPDELERDPFLDGVDPTVLTDSCASKPEEGVGPVAPFGLPLVAARRSFPPSMESAYRALATTVSRSLDATSGFRTGDGGYGEDDCRRPEAHVYPFEDLHVTVATFRTKDDPLPAHEEDARTIREFCADVVRRASEGDGWPREGSTLVLRPRAVRLSRKNAIILWEETSGYLDAMRRRVEEEMQVALKQISNSGMRDVVERGVRLDVPPIVHSTFLRLWRVPEDPGALRRTFREEVFADMLPSEFEIDVGSVALVLEETPCMHVDYDKSVLWPTR